jgi:hypothetical protein
MMQERGIETVELPDMTLDTAELGAPAVTAAEDVVATTANGTQVRLNEPVARLAKPEAQAVEPEPQIAPETLRAAGHVSLYEERSASLVNYQDKITQLSPQERLNAAAARYGGTSTDMIRVMQERNTRRVQAGVETYRTVTALTGGYLPGYQRY